MSTIQILLESIDYLCPRYEIHNEGAERRELLKDYLDNARISECLHPHD